VAIVEHAKEPEPPKKGTTKKRKTESDSDADSSDDEDGRRERKHRPTERPKLTSLSAVTASGASSSIIEELFARRLRLVVTYDRAVEKSIVFENMITISDEGHFVVKIPNVFTNMFTAALARAAATTGIHDVFS